MVGVGTQAHRRRARVRVRAASSQEDGFAMVMVMIITVLVGMLAVVISTTSLSSTYMARSAADRHIGVSATDSAVDLYQTALDSGRVSEFTDYVLWKSAMRDLASEELNDEVLPNTSGLVDDRYQRVDGIYSGSTRTIMPLDAQVTLREPIVTGSTSEYLYWQVYRIELPTWGASIDTANLVVYFRGWNADANGKVTAPGKLLRVEFRTGRFSDYEMLTDAPIGFQDGASIDGPIHSNGFADFTRLTPSRANDRIWARGVLNCSGHALLSTASGNINVPSTCAARAGNGLYINFLRVQDSFKQIRDACDTFVSDSVRCFPSRRVPYTVQLVDNTIRVVGVGNYTVGTVTALLFEDDVLISGKTSGRVMIAAVRRDTRAPAANITITGDVGTTTSVTGGYSAADSLGLVAEGNIIVDLGTRSGTVTCPVSSIHAAMVSMSGAIGMPPGWVTTEQIDNTPWCKNELSISGAMASHRTPVFQWQWTHSKHAGYSSRSYHWDTNLQTNPPPFFPLSDQWHVVSRRDANADCVGMGDRSDDLECR